MPQPAQEPNSGEVTSLDLHRDPVLGRPTFLDLPGDLIRRLSLLSLPGDLNPDPETPGSQAAAVPDRISFRKTHP